MEALEAIRQALTLTELTKASFILFILTQGFGSFVLSQGRAAFLKDNTRLFSKSIKIAGFFFLFILSRSWLALVDKYVPEPYLDEVFHTPQAQTYCEGRFFEWDDKITTPPGLYLLNVAYHKLWRLKECTPFSLRFNNLLAMLVTATLAAECRRLIEVRAAETQGKPIPSGVSFYSFHTGINIALFPVFFFFSGLHYTDVVSTLAVLIAYRNHLLRLGPQVPGFRRDIATVALGVFTLFMRQTNVFWVVVYMGGAEAVHALKSVTTGTTDSLHDPPLNEAGVDDWFSCVLNLALAVLYNPLRLLRRIWPHITILALFAGFVAWNGGVVLGDKSNHIATVHLPQMLYIWPFFAFFSAPLFLPSVISIISNPLRLFRSPAPNNSPAGKAQSRARWSTYVNIPYTLLTMAISLAVVRYNTIIHPFTLADNRHYMFYVFRYTILRSNLVRLALVVPYTLCRWLAWDQLAGSPATNRAVSGNASDKHPSPPSGTLDDAKREPIETGDLTLLSSPSSTSSLPPHTSTALLLVLTTTLSLVTAPLVEPRYFILPWVFYRLLMPSSTWPWGKGKESGSGKSRGEGGKRGWRRWVAEIGQDIDLRLVLETVWFMVVNLVTMYMFLFRGFYWRRENGEVLDGGRIQRFMW